MPKETIKIKFSEEDLKELIAEKYGLKLETAQIYVSYYAGDQSYYTGDQREPDYTSIIVEGERMQS